MIEQPEKNIDRNKAPGEWLAGWLAGRKLKVWANNFSSYYKIHSRPARRLLDGPLLLLAIWRY